MDLLRVSKFKLQLRALVTEVRELRERERSSAEQVNHLIQKQKATEEEFTGKLTKLQAELSSSHELCQKFERKVNYLQDDNALLENKQKELKGTVNNLIQSREGFLKVYEDSTCEMKRSIEARDRKIDVLSEKINSHLLLFDSILKEAFSVKQAVDNAQRVLTEKEDVVAGLKDKVDKISTFEKLFVEKIDHLECKVRNHEDELRRKDKVILQLEAQLETAKFSNKSQLQLEELQETLLAKEMVIQNLIAQNEALHFELRSLEIIMKKIQETVAHMNEEDRRALSSVFGAQEECATTKEIKNDRIHDLVQNSSENSSHVASTIGAAENAGSPRCQEHIPPRSKWSKDNNIDSNVLESACSPQRSAFSEPQSAAVVQSLSGAAGKEQLDTECSSMQVETS